MTASSTQTRRVKRPAALSTREHLLNTREKRTWINYALRAKGIPAKACSKCQTIKALTAFSTYSNSSDGLASYCRDCHSATHARRMATEPDYRERHRSSNRVSARKRYSDQRDAIREGVRKRRLQYVAANANRVRDPNVLKRCAGQCGQLLPETEFRLNRGVKDGLRDRCAHCSDAEKRARRACLEAYGDPVGHVCYLCGNGIVARSEAWVDHVIPQSKGGPDTAENVRWSHGLCNTRRGNKPLTTEQAQRLQLVTSTLPGGEL